MNLLVSSAPPAGAGLQSTLADGDTAETLARRGARLDNVVVAAAMGRLHVVKRMVIDKETLSREVWLHDTVWYKIPRDAKTHIEMGVSAGNKVIDALKP